jgi:DNA-binding XRE family transcriptional regulator
MPGPNIGTRPRTASPEPVLELCYFNNALFRARTSAILGENATAEERAAHIGIARSALYRMRDGYVRVSVRRARFICRTLGVTVDDLFPEEDPSAAKAA